MKNLLGVWLSLAASAALLTGCNSASESTAKSPETKPTANAKRPAPPKDGPAIEGETIKLGLVASLNGELKPWGDDSKLGAELAVDEINKAGGINGKKIELLVEDSNSKPEQGKTAADRLISKGVVGVVGEVASGITAQIADSAYQAGVPVVAVGATRTDLTDIGSNVFRVCYTDDFQGPVMAKFGYDELGLRRVAVLTDQKQPYSQGLSESFIKTFQKLGGTIVKEEFYNSGDQQFNGQLTNIKGLNPDGMFLSGYFTEVGLIARQARDVGLKVKLLGGDGWDSQELISGGGEGIVGGYFCNHYNDNEDRKEVKDFLALWKAKYNGKLPGTTMGALAYDAVTLMADAVKRAPTPNAKGIIEALDGTENFHGVSGTISLKGHQGNPPKRALVVEVTASGIKFRKAYEHFE
ncbi:MAG: ABC transporter substrate-binding protein [Fimbriimonadaceae bacterium]|nr:ABC transporter substrate-binding protein [Fimbriimonadaceae bacterium]